MMNSHGIRGSGRVRFTRVGRIISLTPVVALSIAGSTQSALAQAAASVNAQSGTIQLETIEVNARRAPEKLTDVPESVGVVEQSSIRQEAPSNAAIDISRQTPNYSVTDVGNPLFAFGSIRGVGTLSFPQNPFDSTISYALNGTPISLYAGTQQLLDVSRVEVLRGPQNVLFGRASEGGTINIVPEEPDGTRDLRVRTEVGTYGNYLTDLITAGSLVPGVLDGRAAIRFTGGTGNVRNLESGQNLPDDAIGAARGSLRWYAGEATTVTVSGFYERDSQDTFNYILRGGKNYPAVRLDQPLGFDRSLGIGTAEVKQAFSGFDVTASFGYQNIQSHLTSDNTDGLIYSQLTGLPPSFFVSPTCSDCTRYNFIENAYSAELRASSKPGNPLRWIAGLDVYDSHFEQNGTNTSSFGPTQNGFYDAKMTLLDYSAFGEVGVPLTDKLTFTPGVRVGHNDMSRLGSYISNGTPGTVPFYSEYSDVNDTYAAGGASLSYKINPASLVYGSIKRGYSGPGYPYFNIYSVFGKPDPSYPASYNMTYEAGGRTAVFDGRLAFDASVFYNNVKNGHVAQYDPFGNTFTIAALDYDSYGFESSARARFSDEWAAYGKVGYTHAAFTNVAATDASGARNGGRLPGVPAWSGVVGVENTLPLGRFDLPGMLVSSVELQLIDKRAADIANTFDLHPYQVINATIGWKWDRYKVYVFGRNLLDENIELAGVPYTKQILAVTPGLPRVVGAGAEITF